MDILDFCYIKLSQASVLLPVLFGWHWYKNLTQEFRLLFWFFVSCVFFEIQASALKKVVGNNMPGLHLYTATQMFAFSYVFRAYMRDKRMRDLITVNFFVFLALAIADATVINTIWKHNTIARPYASMSFVIYALIFFYQLLKSDRVLYSWQYPMFWFSLSALIYFALNAHNFILNNYLIKYNKDIVNLSVYTHALLNIIAHCLSAQSFRCFRTQKST